MPKFDSKAAEIRFHALKKDAILCRLSDECLATVAIKQGGGECGPTLAEGLPMVREMLSADAISRETATGFAWRMCGRGSDTADRHATGKKELEKLGHNKETARDTAKALMRQRRDEGLQAVKAAHAAFKVAPATKPASKGASRKAG